MSNIYWTLSKMERAARRCKNRAQFAARFPGAYDRAKRLKILHHLIPKKYGTVTKERAVILARSYASRTQFKMGDQGAYECLRRHKMLDRMFGPKQSTARRTYRHSLEELLATAKQFDSVIAFRKKHANLYMALYLRNALGVAFAHVDKQTHKWVKTVPKTDLIRAAAESCSSRKEFRDNYSGAHTQAYRFGIIDAISKHMPKALPRQRVTRMNVDKS